MKKLRKAGTALMVVFVGMQFFQHRRNHGNAATSSDFITTYKPPEEISMLLKNACYNCHSNFTNYPWYSYIQPAGWILERHIRKGKETLNFSEFTTYSSRRKRSKLKAMINQIKDGTMPLSSYTFMHPESQLTESEKQSIVDWINQSMQIHP